MVSFSRGQGLHRCMVHERFFVVQGADEGVGGLLSLAWRQGLHRRIARHPRVVIQGADEGVGCHIPLPFRDERTNDSSRESDYDFDHDFDNDSDNACDYSYCEHEEDVKDVKVVTDVSRFEPPPFEDAPNNDAGYHESYDIECDAHAPPPPRVMPFLFRSGRGVHGHRQKISKQEWIPAFNMNCPHGADKDAAPRDASCNAGDVIRL